MKLTRRVFASLALTTTLALSACGGDDAPGEGQTRFERVGDRSLGSNTAPITMVEYASVACGHCATFHEEVWPTLENDYIGTGQVRFVFREMLTGSQQHAIAGFALAHCVADDQYFDMVDLLFQQQRAIFEAARNSGGARSQYLAIARSLGLSEQEFDACLSNEDIQREILASNNQALEDGINSTPQFLFNGELLEARRAQGESTYTYFLGGQQLIVDGEPIPGLVDEDTFRKVLDHLIARTSDTEESSDTEE
jgi:protein-disulfide isomerase